MRSIAKGEINKGEDQYKGEIKKEETCKGVINMVRRMTTIIKSKVPLIPQSAKFSQD